MKRCPKCEKAYEDTVTLCPDDGAVLERDGDGLIGQTLADKYRIDELISQGGMGTVYRATHILMDKVVAIKVLNPSLAADEKIVARFSREARAASRISHPHALNVTDFGESQNGVVFLVMEYLRGRTLKEVIQSDGPMSLQRVVEIIRQVSGALDAAHGEGVVHRDLKSDNIMLVDVGNDSDWAKVLDFGIAKIKEPVEKTDSALTSPNLIIGTPQYMSPEQCSQAAELDKRSDIYSLGVILYEMLVGHVPFRGDSPTAIMMKHLQEPPPSVLEERKDLPASVGRIVARAMAKRPEDRFQTVGELSAALVTAADEAPATAATVGSSADSANRSTNRIVVPTGANESPRATANEEYDETTVVRARESEPAFAEGSVLAIEQTPPPAETFNPWRIIVPALVGLIVIFGVIWALTRNPAQPNTNQPTGPLTVDPNSKPVQPEQSPTGQGEQGIKDSSGNTSNSNTGSGGATTATNQNAEVAPTAGNSNARRNDNKQRNENADSGGGQIDTQPERNTNEGGAAPTPEATGSPDDEPPPAPTPKRRQRELPKPTLPPAETPSQSPQLGSPPA